jgi:hypothetical protein
MRASAVRFPALLPDRTARQVSGEAVRFKPLAGRLFS